MQSSVQALEELAVKGTRGEGSADGWATVAAKAKTIADALKTGKLRRFTLYGRCCLTLPLDIYYHRRAEGRSGRDEPARVVWLPVAPVARRGFLGARGQDGAPSRCREHVLRQW